MRPAVTLFKVQCTQAVISKIHLQLCDCIRYFKGSSCIITDKNSCLHFHIIVISILYSHTSAEPFPPLLLFQYGDPHQPHHDKHQPNRQAGRGHRAGCFGHPQWLEQEEERACSRHQRSHHHHDDRLVEVGPAWGRCSAGLRVWTQALTPRVIWKWSFSNCFHGCFTERLLLLCVSPLRSFNTWIMETPASEHPSLPNFLLYLSWGVLSAQPVPVEINAAASQHSYEGAISSLCSTSERLHDASLILLPSNPWTRCNSRWPTTPTQQREGLDEQTDPAHLLTTMSSPLIGWPLSDQLFPPKQICTEM